MPDFGSQYPLRPAEPIYEQSTATALLSAPEVSIQEASSLLYKPVKPWQTRILILQPGKLDDELLADVVIVDLIFSSGAVIHDSQELLEYTALSYTWGDTGAFQFVKVNGIKYPIAENLYLFFKRWRDENEAKYIWVDALCINQYDNKEKATQVSQMLTIYKKALKVVVWLGEAGENTDLTIDYLNRTETGAKAKHSKTLVDRRDNTFSSGVQQLYSRPWILRIWIRQEVWAAKDIEVLCGGKSMSWKTFVDGLPHMSKDFLAGAEETLLDDCVAILRNIWRRDVGELVEPEDDPPYAPRIGNYAHDIVCLIKESLRCKMTDERDRIYALLGMSCVKTRITARTEEDQDELSLRVDYSRSVSLIFQDLTRYVMKRERSVSSILCLVATFGTEVGWDDKLPSWAIDWRVRTSYEPYLYFEKQLRGKTYTDEDEDEEEDQASVVLIDEDLPKEDVSVPKTGSNDLASAQEAVDGEDAGAAEPDAEQDELRSPTFSVSQDSEAQWSTDESEDGQEEEADTTENDDHSSSIHDGNDVKEDLSADSKVTTLPWSGPIESDTGILSLRGCTLAVLTAVLPRELSKYQFKVKHKTRSNPSAQFDKDSKTIEKLQKRFNNMLDRERTVCREQLSAKGICTVSLRVKGKMINFHLRKADVEIVQCQREIVPVAASDHFTRWQEKGMWGPIQFMRAQPADDVEVPLRQTFRSRLFKTYRSRSEQQTSSADETDSDEEEAGDDGLDNDSDHVSSFGDDEDRISGLEDSDDERDDDFRHWNVETLNKTYNQHPPTEYAVSTKACVGDHVVVVEGSALPLVLRPSSNSYTYVCPAVLNNQLHVPPGSWKEETHGLDVYHRLQLAMYEHFQLLLRMRVRTGKEEVFEVI